MKKLLLALAATLGLAAYTHAAGFVALSGCYVDGSTNVTQQASTNVLVSFSPGANTYNIPGSASPDTTNMLPACPIVPGNNINPVRYIGLYAAGSAANAATITFTLASSPDNSHWVTNPASFTLTGTGAGNIITTNFTLDAGPFPYWTVQKIAVSSGVASNLCIIPVAKPGW